MTRNWLWTLMALIAMNAGWAGTRPNFLFIYTDDQRWDAMGVVQREQGERARFPWFTTPNMDRLAAEGVRFRNAFVVNSLCAPSRAVNLTGRYSHENGIASNFRPFPVTNVTHATLIRKAGYTTGYIGKWHMDNQRERPGFDYHASFLGHARYKDPVFIVDGVDTPRQGWIDDISTEYATDFIRRQQGTGRPWSLVVGFKSPHGPFEPPERARDRFSDRTARLTPNFDAPAPYNGKQPPRAKRTGDTVPAHLDYFRCISAVDDCLGRLLTVLDETHCVSNTVVIYTSDNGFYLGEHGLGDKRSAYDESLRVPFLVRFPALGDAARGRMVDEMVLNLDLAPSLLALAGESAPAEMQGRSWAPLLSGPAPAWRSSWLYEYFAERQKGSRVPDITAVRTATAKLVRYPGHDGWTELFDLASDPYEVTNLISAVDHADLRKRMEAELVRLLEEARYRIPDYVDRPDWWGKPGGEDSVAPGQPGLRLHFDFSSGDLNRLVDRSPFANESDVQGVKDVEGRNGRKAARFTGNSFISVVKTPAQNPAGGAWSATIVLRADHSNGVVLARGGERNGYGVYVKDGRPVFCVHAEGKVTELTTAESIVGRWVQLEAWITSGREMQLLLDGAAVGSCKLPAFITDDPHDGMELGADRGSRLVPDDIPGFKGLMESVQLYRR